MNLEIPGTQLKVSKSSLFSISARIATLISPFLSCYPVSDDPLQFALMPRTLSLATLLNPVVFASVYFKNYSERANFKSSCPITMGNVILRALLSFGGRAPHNMSYVISQTIWPLPSTVLNFYKYTCNLVKFVWMG
jgi:hypothetical protein